MLRPHRVFISYSHQDDSYRVSLEKHLSLLQRQGLIATWTDRRITPGEEWKQQIAQEMEKADILLLLISSDFLCSDYCFDIEMKRAMERHAEGSAKVIPIILRAADWQNAPFAKLQALPREGKPIAKWDDKDEAWLDVNSGLRAIVKKFKNSGNFISKNTATLPNYVNHIDQILGDELNILYQLRADALKQNNLDAIRNLNNEIINLQEKMRKDLNLKEGHFLNDGRYRLISQVGKGGFATVWLAFDQSEQRSVAIKVLHTQWASEQSYKARFYQGSYHMSLMRHKNIVSVISPAREDESRFHYFVMEYVDGSDLRNAILAKRLSRKSIKSIISNIGEALIYAHENSIIHRDVKPANILLDFNLKPFLTDFDLVWNQNFTGGTRTGTALGTFIYSAPETLMDAKNPSARVDVYSLAMTTLFCIYGNDLPLDAIRNTIDFVHGLKCRHELKMVLLKGLNWDREKRFSSVKDFTYELEKYLSEEESVSSVEPVKSLPRTRITYEMLRGRKTVQVELPLHLLILGNIQQGRLPTQDEIIDRNPIACSIETIPTLLRRVSPIINCSVENLILESIYNTKAKIEITLRIKSIEDLLPDHICANVPELASLCKLRNSLIFLGKPFKTDTTLAEDYELWFLTVAISKMRRTARTGTIVNDDIIEIEERGGFASEVRNLVEAEWKEAVRNVEIIDFLIAQGGQNLTALISNLDTLTSKQLDLIMHSSEFREVESSWMSIFQLFELIGTNQSIKISLLHCTKEELTEEWKDAKVVSETGIFHHIYSSGIGTFGGHPYSLVIANMRFSNNPLDISLLKHLMSVCSKASAMLICGCNVDWFFANSPDGFSNISITDYMQSSHYKDWRELRESEDSQFLVMTPFQYIFRLPYNARSEVPKNFQYVETSDVSTDWPFANGGFLIAYWIIKSYIETGWFPSLNFDKVGTVLLPKLSMASKEMVERISNIATVPIKQTDALTRYGFLPFSWSDKEVGYQICSDTTAYSRLDSDSQEKTVMFEEIEEDNLFNTTNAFKHLIYMLISCRFRHYSSVIAKEHFRPFSTTDNQISDLNELLNAWIRAYVSAQKDPDIGILRQRPLRFGRIKVFSDRVVGNRISASVDVAIVPHLLTDKR